MTKIMRLKILSILILIIHINNVYSQEQLRFDNLSSNNQISNRVVQTITQDNNGFMWIGTANGLNRYDGYEFKIYNKSFLTNSCINHILQISTGKLLVATNLGLNFYDEAYDKFVSVSVEDDNLVRLEKLRIRTIFESNNGDIYLGTHSGLIVLDSDLKMKKQLSFVNENGRSNQNIVRAITQDKWGVLWIGTYNGLYKYAMEDGVFEGVEIGKRSKSDPINNLVLSLLKVEQNDSLLVVGTETGVTLLNMVTNEKRIFKKRLNSKLSNNVIKSIMTYSPESVVLGTDGGLNILNIYTGKVEQFNHSASNKYSIANDVVSAIYCDDNGVFWFGTNNGVSQLNVRQKQFEVKELKFLNNERSLVDVVINNIAQGTDKSLWLSSANGLFNIDINGKQVLYDVSDGLCHNNTQMLYVDSEDILWVCTSNGLNYYRDNKFHTLKTSDGSLLKYVVNIHQTEDRILWVTHANGVSKIVKDSSGGYYCHQFAKTSIGNNNNLEFEVSEILGDKLWIGTNQGVVTLNLSSGKYESVGGEPTPRALNEAINVIKKVGDNIWIGSDSGLYSFSKGGVSLEHHDILQNKTRTPIYTVSSVNGSELWLASQDALIKYDFSNKKTVSYSYSHDLPLDNIAANSMYSNSKGIIFLGGYGKFIYFNPNKIRSFANNSPVAITKFSLNDSGNTTFQNMSHVDLKWDQNSFAVSFALLNLRDPGGNIYQYKLDGYDDEWRYSMNGNNTITYHQLPAGDYKFIVKGANSYGDWSDNQATISISIQRRWWVYILSYIVTFLVIYAAYRFTKFRMNLNNQLQVEKLERQKIKELNDIRMKFFTNISHEFRTPITLILGPIDNIAHLITDDELKPQINILRQNTNRLLKLIDQIMNLCKLENDEITLKSQAGDIVRFTNNILVQFNEHANKRGVALSFTSELLEVTMLFDEDKMEQIIYNLLYNAIKFTPESGAVALSIKESPQDGFVDIEIKDTGVGIKASDLGRIFECFYQGETPTTIAEQGTGIGLMLVEKFVTMHNGVVNVESEVGVGSKFTISLPILSLSSSKTNTSQTTNESQQTLLIAEDNYQMREYIKLCLVSEYNIIEAVDGEQAWELIKQHKPNMVISDVAMPKMSGVELCVKVRNDFATSNIPIILLTAKSAEVDIEKGIKAGANSYVVKPFSTNLLKLKITSLLNEYKKIEAKARIEAVQEPRIINLESRDERFMRDFMAVIEQNMSSPEFDIKIICDRLGYSHQQVYRKILAMTGKNINAFIRQVRLVRAKQLLESSDLNLSEVMYKVGFSSRTYFNTQFKKEFGKSPNEYKISVKRG